MEYLKKLLGDKYREDMTAEEISVELESLDLVPSANYVPKSQYDKASSDASNWKKQYRETLSEKEQAELDLKELQESTKALERESKVSKLEKKYIAMGYEEAKATDIANALYDNDLDKAIDLQNEFNSNLKKEIEKQTMTNTPIPPAGGTGDKKLTREQRKGMSVEELQALYNEDPKKIEI